MFCIWCAFAAEEPPESLFMKELKRRGMTPTSLLEDSNRSLYGPGENEIKLKEDSGGISKRSGVVSTEYEKDLANQRERSMALNSEGLEVDPSSFFHILLPFSSNCKSICKESVTWRAAFFCFINVKLMYHIWSSGMIPPLYVTDENILCHMLGFGMCQPQAR